MGLTPRGAMIYFREPSPSFNYWFSISCDPRSYDEKGLIAHYGEQWNDVPKNRKTVFHITKYSHAWFSKMMREQISNFDNKTPEQILKNGLKRY